MTNDIQQISDQIKQITEMVDDITETMTRMAERLARIEKVSKESFSAALAPAPRKPQPDDEVLFGKLRAWRRERGEADGIEPFKILGDSHLTAIATAKPCDRYELMQIHGIGPYKFGLYGGDIIAIVREYVDSPEFTAVAKRQVAERKAAAAEDEEW